MSNTLTNSDKVSDHETVFHRNITSNYNADENISSLGLQNESTEIIISDFQLIQAPTFLEVVQMFLTLIMMLFMKY